MVVLQKFYHMDYKIENTNFEEVKLVEPSKFVDNRGSIFSMFDYALNNKLSLEFGHVKIVNNFRNVFRGVHYGNRTTKLVSCLSGSIIQFVVDCRPESKTYLEFISFHLREGSNMMVLIPPGFGNAFYCETDAVYCYALSYDGKYEDVEEQQTLSWKECGLNRVMNAVSDNLILSERDNL